MNSENNRPGARPGNSNAQKKDSEKALSYIHARVKASDKAQWVKNAQNEGLKLTEWITKTLNNATDKQQKNL